ncbi:uncharacterized protein LOC124712850 [Schistocerca piceifrons]|uniref:uncharacterized protein LOC124712850 n=1 Tax=Schistocerca piceifrons TaxID=274613 RepID=UPI001F5E52D0|nr:uncharacterized protein LOC124712850 [Schistocerca piceifrons]XP_049941141.1 uncharacterized protein LOC126418326 [Schistocerca serialis cubense]
MTREIDTKRLISLVKERPVIWDKTLENYKVRIHTKNAWIGIFKELNGSYQGMNYRERTEYGKSVMRKWTNVRDSFHKSERKNTSSFKSRFGKQTTSTYIYGQELQFLKKASSGCPTEVSKPVVNEDSNCITDSCSEEDSELKETVPKNKGTHKQDTVEQRMADVSKQHSDRHISFFRGIIPSLETFDDDEIVEFQLNVLQIIANIKKRKRTSTNISEAINVSQHRQAQSPSIPVHSSCQNLQHVFNPADEQISSGTGTTLYCDSVEQKCSRPPSSLPNASDNLENS